MNDHTLETLLRHSPRPRPPAGLLDKLRADLPPSAQAACLAVPTSHPAIPWLRRWLPALGFSLWIVGCVIVLGFQANVLSQLRREQQAQVRAQKKAAELLHSAEATRRALLAEVEQLQKDLGDVQRLRTEVEQLRANRDELDRLLAENSRLKEELKASRVKLPAGQEFPIMEVVDFAGSVERAAQIRCVNNLKRLGLAARIWANDHKEERLPVSYDEMKAELSGAGTDKVWCCPASEAKPYELLSPGALLTEPWVVFAHCPAHHTAGLADGSVQLFGTSQRVVQKDGRWILEKTPEK